ncbi:MAG: hypothetical protein ABI999_05520 [Acidobacteriota bacterium]
MPVAVKISLLFSGLFLLSGMATGIWKYRKIMASPDHTAPVYVDIAHRTSFFYCFASLVISRLVEFSPFGTAWQVLIVAVPLSYFVLTVIGYIRQGYVDKTKNMFEERNFITTWFMYGLIGGEIGGFLLILGGFIYSQFL